MNKLNIHRKITSTIANNNKKFETLLKKYKTFDYAKANEEKLINDFLVLVTEGNDFSLKELSYVREIITNTFKYCFTNKAFGKGFIANIRNIFFNIYFEKNINNYIVNNIFFQLPKETIYHSYVWFYNSYIKKCQSCLNENLIIPFKEYIKNNEISFEGKFNLINEESFFKRIKNVYKIDEFNKINNFFLDKPEMFYVKTYIDKYFFKINSKINTAIKEVVETPIGYFFLIKEEKINNSNIQSNIFFYGKTKNFIDLQEKLTSSNTDKTYLKDDYYLTINVTQNYQTKLKAKELNFNNNDFKTIVATNGLKGGDAGHGGITYLAFLYGNRNPSRKLKIKEYIEYDYQKNNKNDSQPINNTGGIEIFVRGDWELIAIYEVFKEASEIFDKIENEEVNSFTQEIYGEKYKCVKTTQGFSNTIFGISDSKYKKSVYIRMDVNEQFSVYVLTSFAKKHFKTDHFNEYYNLVNGKLELIFKCENKKAFKYLKRTFLNIKEFLKQEI